MNNLDSRTLTIKRTFDTPVDLVWNAWTQAEHLSQWWGPPGMNVDIQEHNLNVGGTWKYVMQMPDGNDFISEGKYSEIVELQKIVTSADFKPMTEGVELQLHFEDNDGKTEFTFKCVHATEEYSKQQENMGFYKGWGSAFDRLENHINALMK